MANQATAQKEIGSTKTLGDVTLCTRRMFHNGDTKIFESVDGSFILPNGEPIGDRALLNMLPEPHKTRALAWFDKANQVEAKNDVPAKPKPAKAAQDVTCEICKRTFKNKGILTNHMKSHTKAPVE